MKIALAGNPNSGKTTLYNSIIAVDLPGAYSMSPFTSEESITEDFVKNENKK